MVLKHLIGLFTNPANEWERIRDAGYSTGACLAGHTLLLALVPAIASYVGTTEIGWEVAGTRAVKLTPESALRIAVLYYGAMVVATFTMGWMIHWMSRTYGAEQPLSQCVALATYTATPLFLSGVMQLYPLLWLNLVLGLPVVGYTIYLFYTGVPIVMRIPPERGFLLSSAVLAFGMVSLVAMLAVTVILWSRGFAPAFTS
ncbi:Yip1 family protein [Hydrogenophaga sp.]|uniref:Yip1 family protein n=1 Tax=Hydrogenophaga sp. TaxID=1904254 RepID=UPI0026137433|nr:Yip1 family protein [Hydrogenophaga sp.]MCW5655946.1 YIP1 family protein [Hydrogenophaga sp.]